jgi:hypothetical protein
MTSVSEPRFSSRRVRSSMISMSGRRAWTFWAYHSGVEKPHQLRIAAFGLHRLEGVVGPRRGLELAGGVYRAIARRKVDQRRDDERDGEDRRDHDGGVHRKGASVSLVVQELAGESRQEVDDGRRQDRQPRPGHQRRPEVVRLMSALTYDDAKKQVIATAVPVRSA